MDAIRRHARPALRKPIAIIAFEGWSDACTAASGAVRHLLDRLDVKEPFASLEPEEFYNFQEHRPVVSIVDGRVDAMTWPEPSFFAAARPDHDRDLIMVIGDEPTVRWKTFARTLTQVLTEADVESVLLLGAYIGQVTHGDPVPISGVATDAAMLDTSGLTAADYHGATGIVTVLAEACREVGLPAMSIWAETPHYLAASSNPMASRALLRAAGRIAGFEGDDKKLRSMEAEFVSRVDEAVSSSSDLADYIEELASRAASNDLDPQRVPELVNEIEQFLKDV
ncbi:MAG: filament polymerization regulator ParJ [Acidimicrobiia bacterium]|nr:MAG: filament polymerization regulator ParJ [Acidimicrobiia bacterium]